MALTRLHQIGTPLAKLGAFIGKVTAAISGEIAAEDARLVLRLLYGDDRRNPIRALDLVEAGNSRSIWLAQGGFNPNAGQSNVVYSGGSIYFDGEERVRSNRDNARMSLTYNMQAGSAIEFGYLQGQVNRFAADVRRLHERGEGQKVWLEYRWQDDLASLPAPVWGQLSQYYEILDIEPAWPDDLHGGMLLGGKMVGVVATLVCKPYAIGLEQAAGIAAGTVLEDDEGVIITRDTVNQCANPSFAHDTWNQGWSVSSVPNLNATQETRDGFTRSYNSAARLANKSTSTDYNYTSTITFTSSEDVYLSCYVRRLDGEAVTSADMEMYAISAAQTTTFLETPYPGWYRAFASVTHTSGAQAYGVEIKAGRSVIIDDVQCELERQSAVTTTGAHPNSFVNGDMLGVSWAGTEHYSNSTSTDGSIEFDLTHELTGTFTISGWVTPLWAVPTQQTPYLATIFDYCVSGAGTDVVNLSYDGNNTRWDYSKIVDSTSYGGTVNDTLAYGTPVHLALVQTESDLILYVDGAVAHTDNNVPAALDNLNAGVLVFGESDDASRGASPNVKYDGWRIWDVPLTATQIDTIYDNELPIKTAGGCIGKFPYLWANDGDGSIENADGEISSADNDNWLVVGGVSGDVEATVEWQLTPSLTTQPSTLWLGRKALENDVRFEPYGTFWIDFDATADVGNSSGDGHATPQVLASGGASPVEMDDTVDSPEYLRGRTQVLMRLRVTAGIAEIRPHFQIGTSTIILGDIIEVATNANFLFRGYAAWDMWIDWRQSAAPTYMRAGIQIHDVDDNGTNVTADYIQFLPYPMCRVEYVTAATMTLASGDTIVIRGRDAYVLDASNDDNELYQLEHSGEDVTVEPNKLNYIMVNQATEGEQVNFSANVTAAALITPRYLLPGPPRA
jgi:hypothetical protein